VNGHLVYCGVESVKPEQVPPHVIRLGIDAANAIGRGLYGVDIKNANGDAYVIEVNDNPSIESGEDDCYPRVFEQIVSHLFAK
jgi:glutathione synthase/RimK-type ligase-like ATP-grasp enzyme